MNNLKYALFAAMLVLIGAGCFGRTTTTLELPPAPSADITAKTGEEELKPYYVAYSAEAAAQAREEGRPIVYYFWASWCPICRADEPIIKFRIENSGLPIAGFRVNFDTQSDLKAQYKVPYQHTTIFLNANGEEVARLNGPVSDAEFTAALEKTVR